MKRIYTDSDLKIRLGDIKGIGEKFTIRFYTTNKTIYIERSEQDIISDSQFGNVLKLNWQELALIGEGVLNYTVMNNVTDSDYSDGEYNLTISGTTEYYIDSNVIIDDDDPETSIFEVIAEMSNEMHTKDNELESRLDGCESDYLNLSQSLAYEATARQTGDSMLWDSMNSTQSNLNQLTSRVQGCEDDYLNLSQSLAYESQSRQTGDSMLWDSVNSTQTNLNQLSEAFEYERQQRKLADEEIQSQIQQKANANNVYTKAEVDAAIADIDVDLTGFATETWVQNQGYLTQHQDISGKANISDLATVATSGSYDDLSNKPTIPTVPTKVSAFTNDAEYITMVDALMTTMYHGTNDTTYRLTSNVYHVWGQVASLTLTLDERQYYPNKLAEFMFEFKSGSTATTLTLPNTIKWPITPVIESNKKYQVSIVNDIGLIVGVSL